MKNILIAALTLLASSAALAATDHYVRRDGNHVQHLKITRIGDDISGSMDVDFEPNGPTEADRKPCSAAIEGDAKLTGEISYGRIPAGSVVVSGNLPAKDGSHSLYCAVIIKQVDEKTRGKVGINELLRD